MSEKPSPLTVDPVTYSFRRMLKAEPPRVGAATKNRVVVAPFSADGLEAKSPSIRATPTIPEPPGGHGEETRKKKASFYEKGLAESERLQRRRRSG